jgi:hypothetical protein
VTLRSRFVGRDAAHGGAGTGVSTRAGCAAESGSGGALLIGAAKAGVGTACNGTP